MDSCCEQLGRLLWELTIPMSKVCIKFGVRASDVHAGSLGGLCRRLLLHLGSAHCRREKEENNLKTCFLPSPACCFPEQIPHKQSGTYRHDEEKSLQRMSTCALVEVSINSRWRDECMNDRWEGGVMEEKKRGKGKRERK